MAFLDINPLNPGHALVVPKKHYRWVIEVPQFGEYWEAAGKIAKASQKALEADCVNFSVLGDEVPHAHIHVIPRFKNDNIRAVIDWSRRKKLTQREMEQIANSLISALKKMSFLRKQESSSLSFRT